MKTSTIFYNHHEISFSNLLEEGHNMDANILNGTLYNRSDHNFDPLLRLLNLGDVVYDLGAYIGTFSIPMALEGMSVIAFEGFPDNYKRLNVNVAPYSNISTHCVAVSNKEDNVFTQFNDCTDIYPATPRDISYVVLDDYIKENNLAFPSFVKMDIEGMETVALFGMTDLLEAVRPIWQIGYHRENDIKFDGYPGFVEPEDGGFDFKTFSNLDYFIFRPFDMRCNGFSTGGEYLCVPKERLQ